MMRKLVKLLFTGITWGCTISCLISVFGVEAMGYEWFQTAPRSYTAQVLASMLVGLAFSLPTAVYENEKLSRAQQFLIHMGIGFCVYLPVAFYMQWLPWENVGMLLLGLAIALGSALLIWYGFYIYYKNESREMNQQLMRRKESENR